MDSTTNGTLYLTAAPVLIAYLLILTVLLTDLVGDQKLPTSARVLWTITLVALPYLAAAAYLIARGRGMAERSRTTASWDLHTGAPTTPPGSDIATALLADGTITPSEYKHLRTAAAAAPPA